MTTNFTIFEIKMQDSLITTIFHHSRFGFLLQPMFAAFDVQTETYSITETARASSPNFPKLTESEKLMVQSAERCSETNLMKIYSKEKSETDFIKKVEPTTIDTYIRPFIENRHKEILKLIRETDTPVFMRNRLSDRDFFIEKRIKVLKTPSTMLFIFSNKEEFTYTVQIKNSQSSISLLDKPFATLHLNPAQVVIGDQLHYFEDIDHRKLLPFISKSHIEIPQRSVAEYIRKFVVECVKKYDVVAEGINIYQQTHEPQAILTLQDGFELQPVLHLRFRYGNQIFSSDKPCKKEVELVEKENQFSIGWYHRDEKWEKETIAKLQAAGLHQNRTGQFEVITDDEDPETDAFQLIEWINTNTEVLNQFTVNQSLGKLSYYMGEINLQIASSTKADWFDLECTVLFGQFAVPFASLKNHILNNIREYVLPDGSIAILPAKWFARFGDLFRYGKSTNTGIRLKRYHSQIKELAETGCFPKVKADKFQTPASVPDTLHATLRPYQLIGFRWLEYLRQHNLGGCLSDDMGLGKTLQAIALLLNIYSEAAMKVPTTKVRKKAIQLSLFDEPSTLNGEPETALNESIPPSLIVMPTSLIHNWQNELNKFAPLLRVHAHTGTNRFRDGLFEKTIAENQIILTSYGIVRQDIDFLRNQLFHYIILDESQYIKNSTSQIFKCVKQLHSSHKLVLTGTPIENSLSDLWSQMDFINDGILGKLSEFSANFNRDDIVSNQERKQVLLQIIAPFILRRTKEEVAPELPPLTEEIRYCEMNSEQAALYEDEKNKVRNELMEQLAESGKPLNAIALSSLTRLRLLANHPIITAGDYEGESGKFNEIIEQAEILFSEGNKVLIFSSFVKHLQLLADHFETRQWKYAWLTGSTTNREEEISRFNSDDEVRCFFISLKAGGTGLNLTAANYVFIIDPWWNPAAERQAVSRAHRIGQDRKVTLYRFITKNSIEEKIVRLQSYKDALTDALIRPEFSRETIEELLA